MLDNEYMLQYIARERLREAQARASLYSTLLKAAPGWGPDRAWWRRLGVWWRIAVARATQVALPKSANRL